MGGMKRTRSWDWSRHPAAVRAPGLRRVAAGFAQLAAAATLLATAACSQGGSEVPLSSEGQRGRSAYVSACTACHASDPTRDGSLGPAVAGSSRELLEAKVLRNEYPPGYTPKRDSSAMPAYPHVEGDIGALHAYLSEVAGE